MPFSYVHGSGHKPVLWAAKPSSEADFRRETGALAIHESRGFGASDLEDLVSASRFGGGTSPPARILINCQGSRPGSPDSRPMEASGVRGVPGPSAFSGCGAEAAPGSGLGDTPRAKSRPEPRGCERRRPGNRVGCRSSYGALFVAGMIRAVAILGFLVLSPGASPAQSGATAFKDVPADHWAYQEVQALVNDGIMKPFPDGSFQGRTPITRYDFAQVVARMLAHVQKLREQGTRLTPEQARRVNRLIDEFRSELDLLGVRLDSLETRVGDSERRIFDLEAALSNVRLEGFYRLENTFVYDPFDYTNFKYIASRSPLADSAFREPGLRPLEQEAFLRFIGTPFLGGELFRNVDAFIELRARISGPTNGQPYLEYKFSQPGGPIVGDNLDDFATSVVDDQRVSVDKAHLRILAKQFTLRAFSNEGLTDLDNPGVLFTLDSFDPPPFSGIEVNGSISKFSYFASVLKAIYLNPSPSPNGNNRLKLTETFEPLTHDEDDFYNLRLTYEPRKFDETQHRIVIGTTYTESVFSYDKKNDFNRVIAFDTTYEYNGEESQFDLTIEPMFSFGLTPDFLEDRSLESGDTAGNAFKLDTSYSRDRFNISLRIHSFTHNFGAANGQRLYLDTAVNPYRDNFRRGPGNRFDPFDPAETLYRLQTRYDFNHTLLTIFKNFSLTLLAENKEFAKDPLEPRVDDDRTASRYFLQAIADLNDDTHVEVLHEVQYHLPPNEKFNGLVMKQNPIESSKLTVDFKVTPDTFIVGELERISDKNQDAIGPDGEFFRMDRARFQVNSQVTENFSGSFHVEQVNNAIQRDFSDSNKNVARPLILSLRSVERPQRNGLDINTIGLDTNWTLLDEKLALRTYFFREATADAFAPELDGVVNIYVAELGFNFTRALKARYVFGFHEENLKNRLDNFANNNYFEVIYTPSEKTDIKLTYGYEYENAADPYDNGPLLFWKTNKLVQIRAQTEF